MGMQGAHLTQVSSCATCAPAPAGRRAVDADDVSAASREDAGVSPTGSHALPVLQPGKWEGAADAGDGVQVHAGPAPAVGRGKGL